MEPPEFPDLRTYGAHLGDVAFWQPYVRTILARHRRGEDSPIVSGFVGTFPTFLVGEVVIKLFGGFPSWRTCHDAELAAHLLLAEHPSIPAPELLAHGRLYDDAEGAGSRPLSARSCARSTSSPRRRRSGRTSRSPIGPLRSHGTWRGARSPVT